LPFYFYEAVGGQISFSDLFTLTLALIWLFLITFAVTLGISVVNVFHKDVEFLIKFLLFLGFYLTPIIYKVASLPQEVRLYFSLNPLVTVFEMFQDVFAGDMVHNPITTISNIVLTVVFVIGGVLVYKKGEKDITDNV
jgi:teichoic acid transport system permease protein